ncbi:MAG: homoserine dehydrogenase [Nitrososphaerales archaeon]
MRIILAGLGVVGKSFVRLIHERKEELYREYSMKPRIVAISDTSGSANNAKGLDLKKVLQVKDRSGSIGNYNKGMPNMATDEIIEKTEAEVFVDATPTNVLDGEPGMTYMKLAMKFHKNVISVNKGPLALALPALVELAELNHVRLRFSGTVGGGTPMLEFGKRCLEGDSIVRIRGILNGTTNFMLTQMQEDGLSVTKALELAQKKGYAEAEPSLDLDGIDAATKLVIIANLVMERKVTLKDVEIKGIRGVVPGDFVKAAKKGSTIRLIASISDKLVVKPIEISVHDPLAISGALNAVTFTSKFAGDLTVVGAGAGGYETASAILRDMIDIKESLTEEARK